MTTLGWELTLADPETKPSPHTAHQTTNYTYMRHLRAIASSFSPTPRQTLFASSYASSTRAHLLTT